MTRSLRPSTDNTVELIKYEPLENFLSPRPPTFGNINYGPILNAIGENSDADQADDEECHEDEEDEDEEIYFTVYHKLDKVGAGFYPQQHHTSNS